MEKIAVGRVARGRRRLDAIDGQHHVGRQGEGREAE